METESRAGSPAHLPSQDNLLGLALSCLLHCRANVASLACGRASNGVSRKLAGSWDPSVRSRRKQVEIGSPGFWWAWRGLCCVCLHAQVHQQNAFVSTYSSLEGKELTLCRAATPSDPQLHLGLRDATVPALVSVPLLTDKATTLSCSLDHVAPPQFLGFWREGTGCKDPGRAAV